MKYQLKSKNYNEQPSELVLDNLLRDRGIEDPAKWLHPSKDYEYSPFLMHDMKKAVDIIHETLKKQEANIRDMFLNIKTKYLQNPDNEIEIENTKEDIKVIK